MTNLREIHPKEILVMPYSVTNHPYALQAAYEFSPQSILTRIGFIPRKAAVRHATRLRLPRILDIRKSSHQDPCELRIVCGTRQHAVPGSESQLREDVIPVNLITVPRMGLIRSPKTLLRQRGASCLGKVILLRGINQGSDTVHGMRVSHVDPIVIRLRGLP